MPDKVPLENIKVAFLPAAVDACALYRQFIPHLNIPGSKFLFRLGSLNIKSVEGCKVAVVQRQVSEHNLNAIKRLKSLGMKVVYDLDDDIWNLPNWNPGKATFTAMQEGFTMCAAEADILTVSTRGLSIATKKYWSKLNKEVIIVPNSIDLNLFYPKNLVKDDTIVIGWQGSNTHSEDCREAFEVIPEVLDEFPNARMEICGAPAVESIIKWENAFENGRLIKRKITTIQASKLSLHKHCKFRQWVPPGEYPNRFSSYGWDIALAPLANHKFNWSKSAIKMLEAGAMHIPCLVSNVQPYNEFCCLGGDDLKWLLIDFQSQWKTKLRTLINEPERRKHIGNIMYETTKKYFDASIIAQNWSYVFNKVLGNV